MAPSRGPCNPPADYDNPVADITRFPQYKRRRFLTTVEMPRFIRGLEAEHSDYARHAIWMLLLTGLRMHEILKAKWEHVDWVEGTLFIGLTKNGEPLLAPLSVAALARLRMIPRIAGNSYLICGQKPGKHLANLHAAFKRVKKRATIENLRIHDLRRTVLQSTPCASICNSPNRRALVAGGSKGPRCRSR